MSRGWRWRWLAIGLCALAGGALNIYRDIWWNADDVPLGTVTLGDEWQSYSFSIESPPKPQRPLALVLRADQPQLTDPLLGYIVATPGVGRVDVTPRLM